MLADFGAAHEKNEGQITKLLDTTGESAIGTYPWMARELLVPNANRKMFYTKASDIWSFGMTIYVRDLSLYRRGRLEAEIELWRVALGNNHGSRSFLPPVCKRSSFFKDRDWYTWTNPRVAKQAALLSLFSITELRSRTGARKWRACHPSRSSTSSKENMQRVLEKKSQ